MKTILLVDDDPEVRKIVTRFDENSGYDVYSADSVANALASIESGKVFSAAIIDFWLGQTNAVDLLDTLNEKLPGVPVLMISGGGGNISLETTQAVGTISGVTQFLQKPFRKSELLEALENIQ